MKFLGAVLLVLLGFLGASQIDDDLNDDAQHFLFETTQKSDNPAFYYLLGFASASNQDPLKVGHLTLETINNSDNTEGNHDAIEVMMPLPDPNVVCDLSLESCLQGLSRNKYAINDALEQHTLLIRRFNHLIGYQQFQTLTIAGEHEPTPPYQHVSAGNRLLLLSALMQVLQGNVELGVAQVEDNIESVRYQLSLADTLAGKMLYARMLNENISVLKHIAKINRKYFSQKLALLSRNERCLKKPLSHEFAYYTNTINDDLTEPLELDDDTELPKWIIRMLYKPNMTVNSLYPVFQAYADASTLSQSSYRAHFEVPTVKETSMRNLLGAEFVEMTVPVHYGEYIEDFYKLNASIAAFNSLAGFAAK